MSELATEMDVMDLDKALRGLDLGLKKAMASDLDGLRWTIVQKPVADPLGASFY